MPSLPFGDASFDLVLSTFGVMFTPNQEKSGAELARVCRKSGRIGLANWTPDGFIGQLFRTIGKHVPPAPGLRSPALWGTEARLAYYGPTNRAFAALDAGGQGALQSDLVDLLRETLIVPSEYLEWS